MVQDILKTKYNSTKNMIHFSTLLDVHPLTRYCQFSYTSVVLETSILLPPPAIFFQNISTPFSSHSSELRHNGSQC